MGWGVVFIWASISPVWYQVELRLVVKSPCLLAGWSGSFAYRLLLELLRRAAEPKDRVYAHPLYLDGRPLLSGVDGRAAALEPGRAAAVKAVVSQHDLRLLLEAASDPHIKSTCELELERLSFEQLAVELGGSHGFALVKARFAPTAFMFHGKDVLYPSPQRLAYSLAKTYRELFGADLKRLADRAPTAVELVGYSVRRAWVDIGETRRVPAFMGAAAFAIYGNVDDWLALMKLGEAVGVGISRAIGFGKYKVEAVERLA